MARSDDLEWLYRDEPEVEPTRVLSTQEAPEPQYAPPPPPPRGTRVQSPPPPAPPQPTRRRRRRHPFLRFVGTLLVLWLVFLIGTPLYAWFVGTRVESAPSGERPAAQPGKTVLLVGSDARDNLSAEDRARLGTGSTEGRRTDTMMLMHTPAEGKPVLLSLPRDSYVSIPGHKKNKLNAAYAFGGAPLLVQTVEANTGIRVDGYLEVGFLGVVDVVDALGGVEVCPQFDIDDRDSHLKLSKGCQTVDGVTALGYVRMRKGDPKGDLGRVERQRETIGAISKKAASPMTVLNPVRYWQLNMAASKSLARGDDTGLGTMVAVAQGFLSTVTGSGLSLTVPISDDNAQTGAGSSVIWHEAKSQEVFGAIASGNTTALESYR
ncbi:MAG TPA: LCP family protein [Tessaracoccus flavescens]|uniref:LCP family protein n=1 Tax=Tessaracoccus flavescens TaxID=399497 RepID=A0A921ENM1_9ACTN|nr:LCP family protein [Tessaracoccus flavescens]